ncbi:hypothetical protein ACLOJK_032111 [Asimina triloba]
MGWPLFGETLQFYRIGRNGTPQTFIHSRMAKYSASVFKTCLVTIKIAVFCGPAGNKFLFSNENKLVAVWWPMSFQRLFPSSLANKLGDEAQRMRHMLMTFLKPEALKRYVGTIDAATQRHMQAEWEGKGEVKVFPLAKMYTFSLACRLFGSIEDEECLRRLEREFEHLLKGVVSLPLDFPGTAYRRAKRAADAIKNELRPVIERKRSDLEQKIVRPTQDMLSHMLVAEDEQGRVMSETEVLENILVLLFASRDTTSCAITVLMKHLAEMPEVYQGVLREQKEIAACKGPGEMLNWEDIKRMKYSWNVVCESLRLISPAQGSFRQAVDDFTFAGFTIPKGWKCYWNVNTTHTNPEYFPDPQKFDPSRFEGDGPRPYTYVAFGGGPRMCAGKEYARLELLVFLHNVVKRFKWEMVFPNDKIAVDPMPNPKKGLPVRLQPHSS